MSKRLLFAFLVFALALTSAKTYTVTLFQPSVVAGEELKPGDYKLELKDSKVVITNGRQSVESPVKVQNSDTKYEVTSVRYANGDGKYRVQEIRLGGTNLKLVFD